MAGFADIIGHNQIVDHLKNAIRMEKISPSEGDKARILTEKAEPWKGQLCNLNGDITG